MPSSFLDTEFEPRGPMVADTFHEALTECVQACGGAKSVAAMLWPSKDIHAGRDLLLACLNQGRAKEKLSLDELLFILKTARQRGCHAGMNYLCVRLSYAPPVPVKPSDERDELTRQFNKSVEHLQKLADRIFESTQLETIEAANLRVVR